MNRQTQYAIMIASIATVLISGSMFAAEAKSFDKEAEMSLKGTGIFVSGNLNGDGFRLTVSPIEGTKTVFVDYRVDGADEFSAGKCISSDKILKVSATKKASVSLNTAELFDCDRKFGGDDIINANIVGDGTSDTRDKEDNINCETDADGVEYCTRERGTTTEFFGTATISGFGLTIEDASASIEKLNIKSTAWTNP